MQSNPSKEKLMFSLLAKLNNGEITKEQIIEDNNITKDSFYYWKAKYERLHLNANNPEERFINLKSEENFNEEHQSLFPALTIDYPNGVKIRLDKNSTKQVVQSLIKIF